MDYSRLPTKKAFLYLLVVSVALGSILGIFIILRGEWSWYELRVVLTTITIAAASLCGLAIELSKTPAGGNWRQNAGLALAGISAAWWLVGIWGEFNSEAFWKTAGSLTIVTVANVHVCLLSIAKLAARFRWIYLIGTQVIYGLAVLLVTIIIGEIDSEALWRFIAALGVVVAGLTLAIPLLHRISKLESNDRVLLSPLNQRNIAEIEAEIEQLRGRLAQLKRLREEIIQSGSGG